MIQEPTWNEVLKDEFAKPYFKLLMQNVDNAYAGVTPVYPPRHVLFLAFEKCPFSSLRVVILGQDPYHGPHQATGLAFAVPSTIPCPPSLRNIFKEVVGDIKKQPDTDRNLESWAEQGVLLLNTTLTVKDGEPGSHRTFGWETFTESVISTISKTQSHVVFMLWGVHAESKARSIDSKKHCILSAPHPSPLSAYRGFFGSSHFSRANEFLRARGENEIMW